jgi:hypothetical protein
MKNKLLFGAAVMVAVGALTLLSCTSPSGGTGTTTTEATPAASDWWNSPATQAEVAQIEHFAFEQAWKWFTHLGAKNATTRESAIQATVNKIVAEHPAAPRKDVEKSVRAQFRAAAKKKAVGANAATERRGYRS